MKKNKLTPEASRHGNRALKKRDRRSAFSLRHSLSLGVGLLAAGVSSFVASSALATSDVWDGGAGDNNWQSILNWASDTQFPGLNTNVYTSTDDAVFGTAGATGTINLGDTINIRTLIFGNGGSNAAAFTIGDANDRLNFTTTGGINITSAVTTAQNIGVAGTTIALSNAAGATNTFANNGSGLLTIAGNIVENAPSGSSLLTVTGTGNTTITGTITNAGVAQTTTVGTSLLKTGSGTLTISNGSVWGGNAAPGRIPATVFNTSFVAREGILLLNGGTHTVTGEAVIGGVVADGGAGQNAKIQVDAGTLAISGFLSVGRGNGVGAVSSDLVLNNAATVTAASLSAGFNGGNAANLPKGSVTLNNTSALTIGNAGAFLFAESAGSNFAMTLNNSASVTVTGAGSAVNRSIGNLGTGTLTMNGTSTFTAGASIMNVGYQNGTGILTINGGTFTNGSEVRVAASNTNGTFTGSGTVNVAGGTFSATELTMARNNDNVASTYTATFNLTSGTANITGAGGTTFVGYQGGSSTATINISGGAFNQNTTSAANMNIGNIGGVKGTVNVSGTGVLNMDRNSNIQFSGATTNTASNSLNISGGAVTFYSDTGTTVGGTGTIDLMATAATGATNTVNLDGGTLTANQIKATSASGTRVFNFNGGTLRSGSSALAPTFLAANVATTANVRNGGAIIDTNGNAVTIGQTLVHSTVGGDNATDGGLTKQGAGALTLTAANTYTGLTSIQAGTLLLSTGSVNASSAVSVTGGGALTLGNATALSDTLTLSLITGTTFNLNAAAATSETIGSLILDGNVIAPGTYTAAQLTSFDAGITFSSLNGETLTVTTAVPEPSTWAMGLLGLGALGFRVRRQVRGWLSLARC